MSNAGVRSCRVIIHNKIRYFLTHKELSFISHLLYLKKLRECGCRTAYSQEFNFQSFGFNKSTFYRIVKRLEILGLLERVTVNKFTDFVLIEKNYNRLLEVVNSTDNIYALIFFSEELNKSNRNIDSISDIEILQLKSTEKVFI